MSFAAKQTRGVTVHLQSARHRFLARRSSTCHYPTLAFKPVSVERPSPVIVSSNATAADMFSILSPDHHEPPRPSLIDFPFKSYRVFQGQIDVRYRSVRRCEVRTVNVPSLRRLISSSLRFGTRGTRLSEIVAVDNTSSNCVPRTWFEAAPLTRSNVMVSVPISSVQGQQPSF